MSRVKANKTCIWRPLSAALRSKGEIILTFASSGIAELLIPGGRTAHSRFCIPLNVNEYLTCSINANTLLVELIVKAKLIIWDESPMMQKHCFEDVDHTLEDIFEVQLTKICIFLLVAKLYILVEIFVTFSQL
jgi:ATP-dependent DNA helicase PIF1